MDNLPRHLLPQIPKEEIPKFISYMEENGIDHEIAFKSVDELKPAQREVNREKIEYFKTDPDALQEPVIISKDGWILDGHHRWLALKEMDPKARIQCIIFICSINKLIAMGHKFDSSFTKSVHEDTNYSKKLWDAYKRQGKPEDNGWCGKELMVRKTLKPY